MNASMFALNTMLPMSTKFLLMRWSSERSEVVYVNQGRKKLAANYDFICCQ